VKNTIEITILVICLGFLSAQWLPTSLWSSFSDPAAIYEPDAGNIVVVYDRTVNFSVHIQEEHRLMYLGEEGWESVCAIDNESYYHSGPLLQSTRVLNCTEELPDGLYRIVTRWKLEPTFFPARTHVRASNPFLIPG
jgi:hypothetical protein